MTLPMQSIPPTPAAVVNYLLSCDLRTIGEIQTLMAKEGFDLQISTGQIVVEQELYPPANPFDK